MNSCCFYKFLKIYQFCPTRYRVDEVCYVDELQSRLGRFDEANFLLLNGTNSDSGKQTRMAAFDGISNFKTDDKVLQDWLGRIS